MRERGSIHWMIPPRGWKPHSDENQRINLFWYLPDIVIYEPKKRGVYDLTIPIRAGYQVLHTYPAERERSERYWGKTYLGELPPISVIQHNAITISEWRRHG